MEDVKLVKHRTSCLASDLSQRYLDSRLVVRAQGGIQKSEHGTIMAHMR